MDRRTLTAPAVIGVAALALGGGAAIALADYHGAGAGGGTTGASDTPAHGAQPTQRVRPLRIGAWLDTGQEVPSPTGTSSSAAGKFEARLTRRGNRWRGTARLTYRSLTGPAQAAHIHMGMKGVAGPVLVSLCGGPGVPDCRNGVRTPLNLTNAQLNSIRRGAYYVNVHTERNQPGEIRGQLGQLYAINSPLNVGQERPRPRGTRRGAHGRLTGSLITYGGLGHLDLRLTYRRLSGAAQAAHIHRGARGRTGPVAITLCGGTGAPDCRSPLRLGTDDLGNVRGSLLRQLLAGRSYVNVHTARNQPGEIRGQIVPRR